MFRDHLCENGLVIDGERTSVLKGSTIQRDKFLSVYLIKLNEPLLSKYNLNIEFVKDIFYSVKFLYLMFIVRILILL